MLACAETTHEGRDLMNYMTPRLSEQVVETLNPKPPHTPALRAEENVLIQCFPKFTGSFLGTPIVRIRF